MFKVTFFMTALICRELGDVSAYPDIYNNELYYSQISERLPSKIAHHLLAEPLSRANIQVNTVTVTCHPTCMVITVKADLFNVGIPVNAADLRLGTDHQLRTLCGVIATSADEYILEAALTDCGTQHWITEDALVYTNLLVYSPEPTLDGVVRTEDAVIPIRCHYGRKFNVGTNPVLPTWILHQTTQSAAENLAFSLNLMTSDWTETRASSIFFLGDMINMEARMPQMDLLVFIESCVATTTPNTNSVPMYKFVDNGCMVDGQRTGSKSRFLPRTQPNKLQLQLEAFIFYQMRCEIYVTCTLKAYPLNQASGTMNKACSFIDGSWRSAAGDHWTCTSCDAIEQDPPSHQARPPLDSSTSSLKHDPMQADSTVLDSKAAGSVSPQEPAAAWRGTVAFQKGNDQKTLEWQKVASVGPLTIKNKLAPPSVKEVIHHFSVGGNTSIPHNHLGENEVYASIEERNDAPDVTTSEPQTWEMEMTAEALHTVNGTSSQSNSITGPSLLAANLETEQLPDMASPVYGSNSSMLRPTPLQTKPQSTVSAEAVQTLAKDGHGSL
ncbi:zona pellucida sperm-binding protein 3-like [Brachyhypopomus gauderio]|uniref:zona pellucida sperm-binding protein 3-like n=1 Tax=Brachyhypopomus gauderio TaxID=698409 RepID=UPI0040426FA5